ncbi:hypothetical protein LMG24076_01971 [Trinickia soli]|nr:hypothetical protein LMG24076_01971 [Trinickia soli]
MSTGIDVAVCMSDAPASGVGAISASGRGVICTATDGTPGALGVLHLALVDSTSADAFDYTQAAGFWSVAFLGVMSLYVVSRCCGVVLDMIRRA